MKQFVIIALLVVSSFCAGDYTYVDPSTWTGTCSSGQAQSPINIVTSSLTCASGYTLDVEFTGSQNSAVLDIPNNTVGAGGVRDLKQNAATNIGTFTVTDAMDTKSTNDFTSSQFHIHTPSEHTVDGDAYDAELHIVFNIDSGKTETDRTAAVLGMFFKVESGASNTILGKWDVETRTATTIVPSTIFGDVNLSSSELYIYEGSLTTPGCDEIVTFYLIKEPFPATQAEIDALKGLINDNAVYGNPNVNARPVQELNGRTVWHHKSSCPTQSTEESSQIITQSALLLGLLAALLF